MAGKKQAWTATQLKGLLKTRRINQIENSSLATRLKVLDLKKSQTYTQIDMERDSLREDIQKIQHIKKEVPISAERRKLFRNGSRRNDNIQVDTESEDRKLGLERTDGAFLINGHSRKSSGKAESPVIKSNKAERLSRRDSTKSLGTDSGNVRVRHHFRVIDPPNRPGSRRNFLPVPDKVLQKEQQKMENVFTRKEGRVIDKHQTIGRSLSDTSIGSTSKQEVPSPTSANGSGIFRIANDLSNKEDDRGIRHSVSWCETPSGLASTSRDATGRYPGSCSNEKIVDSDTGIFGNATEASLAETPALFQNKLNTSLADHRARKLRSHGPIILNLRPQTQPSHRKSSHADRASQKRRPGSSGTEQQRLTGDAGLLYSMRCRSCFKSCPNLNVADVDSVTARHSTKKNMPCKPNSTKLFGRRRHSFTSTRHGSRPTNKNENDEGVYVYDARPNRSLSKGYQKMQVTVGKKQLSITMPRFSTNTNEPAVARMRAQFISEQFQPRLLAKLTTPK